MEKREKIGSRRSSNLRSFKKILGVIEIILHIYGRCTTRECGGRNAGYVTWLNCYGDLMVKFLMVLKILGVGWRE